MWLSSGHSLNEEEEEEYEVVANSNVGTSSSVAILTGHRPFHRDTTPKSLLFLFQTDKFSFFASVPHRW